MSGRKASAAREALGKNLFFLHPVFREALLRVRAACDELGRHRLHALTPGQLYDLATFVSAHEAAHGSATKMLSDFSRAVVHVAQDSCFRAIELLEQTLLASKEKSSAASKLA